MTQSNVKLICTDCVTNVDIKNGESFLWSEGLCNFCELQGPTISIHELAKIIEQVLQDHYNIVTNSNFKKNKTINPNISNSLHIGQPINHVICDVLGVKYDQSEEIRTVLNKLSQTDDSIYSEQSHFDKKDINKVEIENIWKKLQADVLNSRYFGTNKREILDEVTTDLKKLRTRTGESVIKTIGPQEDTNCLYRARRFGSESEMESAFCLPDKGLGPPPSAPSGRANPHGISVFYGANDHLVTIDEMKSRKGVFDVVAKFNIIKNLKVLDLSEFDKLEPYVSVLNDNYSKILTRIKLLKRLSEEYSKIVLPENVNRDYLFTQIISEYFEDKLGFDGIIYPSVQYGKAFNKFNIVLFKNKCGIKINEKFENKIAELSTFYKEDGILEFTCKFKEILKSVKPNFNNLAGNNDSASHRDAVLELDMDNIKIYEVDDENQTKKYYNLYFEL